MITNGCFTSCPPNVARGTIEDREVDETIRKRFRTNSGLSAAAVDYVNTAVLVCLSRDRGGSQILHNVHACRAGKLRASIKGHHLDDIDRIAFPRFQIAFSLTSLER